MGVLGPANSLWSWGVPGGVDCLVPRRRWLQPGPPQGSGVRDLGKQARCWGAQGSPWGQGAASGAFGAEGADGRFTTSGLTADSEAGWCSLLGQLSWPRPGFSVLLPDPRLVQDHTQGLGPGWLSADPGSPSPPCFPLVCPTCLGPWLPSHCAQTHSLGGTEPPPATSSLSSSLPPPVPCGPTVGSGMLWPHPLPSGRSGF